jgi:gamma-polyglutamate biosynthesis protein CapA
MTEVQPPMDAPAVTWRGRLQRRLRRQRTAAVRHAVVGVVLSAALVVLLSGQEELLWSPALAEDDRTNPVVAGPDDAVFRAAMVGDLMFGRHVAEVAERQGHDALLEHVTPYLDGDYVSGNLEQVISADEDLPEADKLIHLASDERAVEALVAAGFTTLSLANNHTMDHGIPGLRDTIAALDAAGLEHAGAGETLDDAVEVNYQEHGELTVATLSFTDVFVEGFIARAFQGGALQAEPDVFVPMIQRASAEADLVFVHFHWGEEYDIGPSSRQRELAEFAAAAGADVIVGHHPHVLLPAELIGDTIVLYSLGNFVFDQGWSRTRESAIARYELGDDGIARLAFVPVYLREATPQPLSGPLATYRQERIFQRLRGAGLDWQREDGALVTYVDHGHVLAGGNDD